MKLDKIFNPKTIAVIGASSEKGSVGFELFQNLIGHGYVGKVFPVNIKRKSVQGMRAYPSIKECPEAVDLAIIATPAVTVPGIVEECGQAGVGGLVIISAGFKEAGKDGMRMFNQIKELAYKYDMRIIGPNCLGFICPSINLNASFARDMALPGKIAFISQSGALCTAILDWSLKNNVGFSNFVSIGSMADVSFHDLIDYFGQDKETSSILLYVESLTDARQFLSAARGFSRNKPIVVLKVGRSSEGAQATMSHTGSLAGNDEVFDAAFERAGIIRVDTAVELFHVAKTLAMQPYPAGDRLAIVTNAGGPGVIAVDSLIHNGGQVAEISKKTIEKLGKFLPSAWSKHNPVDILGDANQDRYQKTLELVAADPNVDAVLVILTPQAMTDPVAIAKSLVALNGKNSKTMMASWMGGNAVQLGRETLEKGNIPVYRTPEDAVKTFMDVVSYSRNLKLLYETPASLPHEFKPKKQADKEIIAKAIASKRETLTELETKQLLANYGINVAQSGVAHSAEEAAKIAAKLCFPVVMKILSPDIIHKTDIGGVATNISSKNEAIAAYHQIIKSAKKHQPKARIDGIFVEQMIAKKYELIIGCKKDPIFGPVIVFGAGGIFVELFHDISMELPPLNMALALRMINKTKISKVLQGYRGMSGVDIEAIQFLLYKFAYLIADFPEIKELDINPFAVDEKGGVVLDAKAVLDKKYTGKYVEPYSHLVISPYPSEYEQKIKLKSGKYGLIRPIKPEDEPLVSDMFKAFKKMSKKQLFFKEINNIDKELTQRYSHIDYDREIVLVAEIVEKARKKIVGMSRLVVDPFEKGAEFSVAVADPWQKLGLGKVLTNKILGIAEKRHIKRVYAAFLKENMAIQKIFQKKGFAITFRGNKGKATLEF